MEIFRAISMRYLCKAQLLRSHIIPLLNEFQYFLDGDIPGVTSRSGRVIKKSTKLIDFTSPDDIEIVKAKKMASATRKLNLVSTKKEFCSQSTDFWF